MNASAVTINSQLRQQDSFSQTQDEYITILSTCNPEQKPRATCEAFIKMFRAYSRGGNYDFNVLISKEKLLTDNLLYRKSEADFRRAVSEDFGLKIISDSIKLNNVKEEIRGSNALIEIQEKYEYTLENDKDEKFYRNRKYIFTLKKEKESWLIESVKMIATSSMSTYGPYGNTNYGNLNYADKGTIIAINWDGTATQTTLDHAMVVTKVKSGSTLGSRNRSDLYIAANSSQSNSAYEPLLNYCGNYPEANYSTSIIQYGYYPQAQYNN